MKIRRYNFISQDDVYALRKDMAKIINTRPNSGNLDFGINDMTNMVQTLCLPMSFFQNNILPNNRIVTINGNYHIDDMNEVTTIMPSDEELQLHYYLEPEQLLFRCDVRNTTFNEALVEFRRLYPEFTPVLHFVDAGSMGSEIIVFHYNQTDMLSLPRYSNAKLQVFEEAAMRKSEGANNTLLTDNLLARISGNLGLKQHPDFTS